MFLTVGSLFKGYGDFQRGAIRKVLFVSAVSVTLRVAETVAFTGFKKLSLVGNSGGLGVG